MAKSQRVYTPEFRRQIVELHRAGRSFDELAKEFGCTSWSIRQWVKQADRDAGRGDGGLTTAEREELVRLRRENRQLKDEREILSKAAAWFAQETHRDPTEALFEIREARIGPPSRYGSHVPFAQGFHERLLRLATDGRCRSGARVDIGLSAERIHAIHRRSRGAYGAPRSTPSSPTNTRRMLA